MENVVMYILWLIGIFYAIWYIIWPLDTFCGNVVVIWYTYFSQFWYIVSRKIWQPWFRLHSA
jgi:hypothetical protein